MASARRSAGLDRPDRSVRQLEDDEEATDVGAFARGYITVTPLTLDVTDASAMTARAEIATKR